MPSRKRIVVLLRVISALTIFMGVFAMISGLVTTQTLHVFKAPIPAWLLGAAVAYTGVRYWLRLKDLEKKLATSGA